LDRLVGDTVRLQLQLENSLFLASQDELQLVPQKLHLRDLLDRMSEQWPELKVDLKADCILRGDERAMRTVLSNLFQNAILHGGATQMAVSAQVEGERIKIALEDNGRGFGSGTEKLGQLFHRPKSTSGSGLGLYICRLLMRRMNGDLKLNDTGHGFQALLTAEGALA
jgi:signal transduction histidine kinase